MTEWTQQLLNAFGAELAAVLGPSGRLFGLHLLGAALVAGAVWAFTPSLRQRSGLLGFVLPVHLFLHPSSLLDVRLLVARALLGALFFVPAVWSAQLVAVKLALGLSALLDRGPLADVSRGWAVAGFSVAAFLLRDLTRYGVHRAAHRLPVLWALHQVHHSAEVLTPLTLHRTHPLEALIMRGASALAVGLAAGVSSWAFHGRIAAWEIAGVEALGFVWTAAGANLRHSHVWVSYGRALEHLLVSPAQHQLHHSVDPRHHDRNFGEALAFWDWAFGTLLVSGPRRRLEFGLAPGVRNHGHSVASLLLDPVLAVLGRVRGVSSTGRTPSPVAPR